MNVALKLVGFLAALAAVFGVSYLTGTQSQVLLASPVEHAADEAPASFSGVSSTLDGYTLAVDGAALRPGSDVPVSLTVSGPDHRPVTRYDSVDDARLHLIAFRRDLTGYQHTYPTLSGGTWTGPLQLTPGPWRVLVDVQPSDLGREITLAVDVTVPGRYAPTAVVAQADVVQVDGYTVTRTGDLSTGTDSGLAFEVTRDGRPVTDLETFHDAVAHAVVLRPGDLGYLHLHPYGHGSGHETSTGPELRFTGVVPERGTYPAFVEFRTDGSPHVALFTLAVTR